MTNKDFIKAVAKNAGYTIKDVTGVFEAIETELLAAVNAGEDVKLLSGVTIKTSIKDARECRNPLTGEMISVPEKRIVKAAFTTSFKNKLVK